MSYVITDNGVYPGWGNSFSWGGYTYVGFSNDAGGLRVGIVDESTGAVSVAIIEPDGTAVIDQHNVPALLRRSLDDRMVVLWSDHNGTALWRLISIAPLSSDPLILNGFGPSTNIDAMVYGTRYTYVDMYELDDAIYQFHRNDDGWSNWETSKSTDGGVTWSRLVNLTYGTRYYARMTRSSGTRLDFLVSDGSYASDYASLYHCYLEAGVYRRTDGAAMAGTPPFPVSEMTQVHDGSNAGVRGPDSIAKIGDEIVATFYIQTGVPGPIIGEDEDYLYARWDGTTWNVHTIAADIGGLTPDWTEGGLVVDPVDLDHVVMSRRAASSLTEPWRLYDYRTADGGASWSFEIITDPLDTEDHQNPVFVRGGGPVAEYTWLTGSFTTQSAFATRIIAFGTVPSSPPPEPPPAEPGPITGFGTHVIAEGGSVPPTDILTEDGQEYVYSEPGQ